ncbi:hypothetical protein D4R71_03025 [bacterium]|nr:MAG: hypothetical protein D4R71_03025 [bacterium]
MIIEAYNKKINLTGTAMYESERAELRKKFFKIQTYCAPYVQAGYFYRQTAVNRYLYIHQMIFKTIGGN